MKKVIIITTNIAPYRLLWCEELSKYYDVTIYYSKDKELNYNDEFLKHESKTCHIIRMKTKKNDGSDPLCLEVINIIKDNQNSCIIFDGYGPKTNILGLAYCKIKGIRNFVNVDGYPTERTKSKIKEIIKKLVISKLCDNFFCSGKACKQHLISYGAKENKIFIHNFSSINENRIVSKPLTDKQKQVIRKKLKIKTSKKIVLGVGRFVQLKRFEDLIQAVINCQSDCELYLLGGKPTKEYLEIVGKHKNIHFLDFVLPELVDDYYKAANLFVLPSETDVWGLVVNEAIAQGLPIICSDSVVAGKNLVKNNGYIFETYNIDQLTKCIDLCLDSKNNKFFSNNSLKVAHEYTIEGIVKRQKPVINRLFDNKL